MQHLKAFVLLVCISSMFSCERNEDISVRVMHSDTGVVLDSVLVKVSAGRNGDYDKNYSEGLTDSSGEFSTSIMIGCTFGCYDIRIEYEKLGYKNYSEINNPQASIDLVSE